MKKNLRQQSLLVMNSDNHSTTSKLVNHKEETNINNPENLILNSSNMKLLEPRMKNVLFKSPDELHIAIRNQSINDK